MIHMLRYTLLVKLQKLFISKINVFPKKRFIVIFSICLLLGVLASGISVIVYRNHVTIQKKDQEIRSIKKELEDVKQDSTDLKKQLEDAKKEITFNPANLLQYTKQEWSKNRRGPLLLNASLNASAKLKASDMVTKNYWSHYSPSGEEPWAFFRQVGYKYYKAGENLAYGQKMGQEVIENWMNSPKHKDNLLDNKFKEVGFGVVRKVFSYNGSHEVNVIVAHYGSTY